MRSLVTLAVSSLLLAGCGLPQFPRFPEKIKHTYVIDIDPKTQEVSCAQFQILSRDPVITKFVSFVDLMECQNVEGFQPADTLLVRNYLDDVQRYSRQVKCKLK